MKLMVVSDIHGSAYYAEKTAEAFIGENADRLLILGDTLYHGPRNDLPRDYNPKRVAEVLNRLKDKTFGVRGNCDAEIDQVMLEFPIMAQYSIIALDNRIIFATHGDLFNIDNPPQITENDILLYGHFHVPACKVTDKFIYMNPGSASIPKENSPHSYLITDGKHFLWKDLDTGSTFMEKSL